LVTVFKKYYPDLEGKLNQLTDLRKYFDYEPRELMLCCIAMFMFKRGSRNKANEMSRGRFAMNFEKIFHVRVAHMDSVNKFLCQLPVCELEAIKRWMVSKLFERKTLHKYRLLDRWFVVAIDGTGVCSFDYEPFEGCPFKEYENGKKVWTVYVLEAKIVCTNGFSISIDTEWVKSKDEYDKQDCELKAFYRLEQTLKTDFPKLPICIAADGLYPNQNVFDICQKNNWMFIINLKDGCLRTLWEEIGLLRPLLGHKKQNNANKFIVNGTRQFFFINNLEYDRFELNWIETKESIRQNSNGLYFAHITNLKITSETANKISCAGRQRWNIENQGFDIQKNHGYNLCHKYSRKSFNAMANYYQCLQIAHLINQLTEKCKRTSELLSGSNNSIIDNMVAFMQLKTVSAKELAQISECNCQFRY
jgi:hypothetical protein